MVLRQGGEPTPQVIYAFIETQKTEHRISRLCRVLKISESGFYGWSYRKPSARERADAVLSQKGVRRWENPIIWRVYKVCSQRGHEPGLEENAGPGDIAAFRPRPDISFST